MRFRTRWNGCSPATALQLTHRKGNAGVALRGLFLLTRPGSHGVLTSLRLCFRICLYFLNNSSSQTWLFILPYIGQHRWSYSPSTLAESYCESELLSKIISTMDKKNLNKYRTSTSRIKPYEEMMVNKMLGKKYYAVHGSKLGINISIICTFRM